MMAAVNTERKKGKGYDRYGQQRMRTEAFISDLNML